ncbi:leucine-rich repeat domain-containing protein, partial [Cytobacillus praedii]|uniref:leucine-rich repeat domain-containing protein n=1 Tax=Cytobacillus praedii TaxID=1742358 RepID=UPI002E228543|nr:leucine-rich repeat domain-containing protein [Cytobacillus praedii]
GLVGLKKLSTLNISGTKVKELNVLWNETEARFPSLTNLQAANIDTLTSIGGLVEVTNVAGFNPEGLIWNLGGSILSKDPDNHIGHITAKFQNNEGTFTAPTLAKSTPLEQAAAAKENFKTAYDNKNLDWDTLITAIYYLNVAEKAGADVKALKDYYAGIDSLDMSNKDTSKYAISTGALVDFTGLTSLDLSGVTSITELGGLVGLKKLTTLNISGTKVTELNVLWNETEARFPDLTNLQAANIETLTSIGGLVEVTNVAGFNPAGLTWNLSGSTLSKDPDNHIGHITTKFENNEGTFTAPTLAKSTPLELATAAKDNFETAYAKGSLDWDTLITAIYYLNEARAAKEEVSDLEAYYAGIESLDMSNKDTSKYAISTGALVDFTGLKTLDLSGVTNLTELGGLVGLKKLSTLNISGTKVKELNVLWNETEARFPDLTNLQAANIDTLTSIGGLVEVTNVAGFNPAGLTWNLSGSILAEDPHDHIGHITSKFTNGSTFTAPMVKDSAPAPTAETLNIGETFTLQDGIVSFI